MLTCCLLRPNLLNLSTGTRLVHGLSPTQLFTEPGKSIINGTIIIRNGVIQAVGRNLKIPKQANALRMDGKHIYAGFINGLVDVASKADSASLELHWNTNMRAHLRASDIFKGKKKTWMKCAP